MWHAASAQHQSKFKIMEKNYLVLGATGSIGFAFTRELLSKGLNVTILVRNKQKAKALFDNNELLEIVEGDVTDLAKLKEAALDKDLIFHGINYPYQLWDKFMKPVTQNIIEAAQQNRVTILFPGNIYPFGNVPHEITEESIPTPSTKKGLIRLELNEMLKAATDDGGIKVIVMRLPDFFGPNVTNGLIEPIFGNASKKKPMEWLINADIPHQFVYTLDAAKLFFLLSEKSKLPNYYLINYGGEVVPSLKSFGLLIGKVSGGADKVKVIPKFLLSILAWFVPVVKELKENFYQFENTIQIDDSKIKSLFPDFKATSMEDAIRETIQWFKNNTY